MLKMVKDYFEKLSELFFRKYLKVKDFMLYLLLVGNNASQILHRSI